jgi:hypothetical protein
MTAQKLAEDYVLNEFPDYANNAGNAIENLRDIFEDVFTAGCKEMHQRLIGLIPRPSHEIQWQKPRFTYPSE